MNKISEKAVWDELCPSEDEKKYPTSFGQSAQPQMMFCYNCNQVIPANSAFCPWCQTELFVTCPKCGNKYSSQYPICNQCGTDRKEYILQQNLEKQRQEEIEERKRREEAEKQFKAQREEAEKQFKAQQEEAEIARISKSTEYMSVYSTIKKGYELFVARRLRAYLIHVLIMFILWILSFVFLGADINWTPLEKFQDFMWDNGLFVIAFIIPVAYTFLGTIFWAQRYSSTNNCLKYIKNYIHKSKSSNQELFDCALNKIQNYSESFEKLSRDLPKLVITAYREVYVIH